MENKKKERRIFMAIILSMISAVAMVMAINYFIDPFGAFTKEDFWYANSMTRNPRTAKLSYLSHQDDYNAYIVGSSGSSAIVVENLNKASGKKFYNNFYYGAYMPDIEDTVKYLVDEKQADEILFPISFSIVEDKENRELGIDNYLNILADKEASAFNYYKSYLFADLRYAYDKVKKYRARTILPDPSYVFELESGNYDKRARDVEPIGDRKEYLEKYPAFKEKRNYIAIKDEDKFFASLERVKNYCDEHGVKFDIILYPLYEKSVKAYDIGKLNDFLASLSEVTDYWDFTYSSLSYDPRLFYDIQHYRNTAGNMMIDKIYGLNEFYLPEDFGVYVKKGEQHEIVFDEAAFDEDSEVKLTALMLHSVCDIEGRNTIISEEKLESLLQYIQEHNYHTVSQQELLDYVYQGIDLPENPVVLTFDDGYYDNYSTVFPLLEKYDAKAVFFPIGISNGKDVYRDTNQKIFRHYGNEEIRELMASGLVDFGSHTYDLHRVKDLEPDATKVRTSILKLEEESLDEYVADIRQDFKNFKEVYKDFKDYHFVALSYPLGKHDTLSEILVREAGFKITYTTQSGYNYLVKGLPQSLLCLKRINIEESTAFDEVFEK